jgi:hypothetical protein
MTNSADQAALVLRLVIGLVSSFTICTSTGLICLYVFNSSPAARRPAGHASPFGVIIPHDYPDAVTSARPIYQGPFIKRSRITGHASREE